MTLNPIANFPSARCYVLKLHRDAAPATGRLIGRLEHIATGAHVDFASGEELLAWMLLHAAQTDAAPSGPDAAPD